MKRFKVLLLSQSVEGYQNYTRHALLLEHAVEENWQVSLVTAPTFRSICPRFTRMQGFLNIRSVGVLGWRWRRAGLDPLDTVFRMFLVVWFRPDVIHCDGHRPATLFPSLFGQLIGARVIAEWVDLFSVEGIGSIRQGGAGHFIARLDDWLERFAKKSATGVVAISTYLKERAIRDLGIPGENVALVRGGCMDINTSPSISIRREINIGFFGFEMADLEDLVSAATAVSELASKYPQLKLVVTGKDVKNLEKLLEPKVMEFVSPIGWLDFEEYPKLLEAMDLFILPMEDTPRNRAKWPMKLGDYMSVGKEIIAADVGEISVINHKFKCLRVYSSNLEMKEQLADAICALGETSWRGDKCKELAVGELSWKQCAATLFEMYTKILSGGARK